jgi:hypothetical protein
VIPLYGCLFLPQVCQDKAINGIKCASAATKAIRAAANAAKYMAEFPVRGCNQKWSAGYYKCGERLEGASWEYDSLGTNLGETIEFCQTSEHEVPKGQDDKPLNFGSCVGKVMSSAGYTSTAGLYLASGVDFDCPSALTHKEYKGLVMTKNDPGYNEYNKAEDTCGQEAVGFVRTMFLASTKAVRAGGSCAGVNTVCAQNALLSAAAFAGIGQVGAILYDKCQKPETCCNYEKDVKKVVCNCDNAQRQELWALNRKMSGECGRYAGSMAKLMASAFSFAMEAQEACSDGSDVPAACGSMITFAIASLGYFAENAARNYYECPFYKEEDLYQCGQDQSKIGEAVHAFIASIAAAVINLVD